MKVEKWRLVLMEVRFRANGFVECAFCFRLKLILKR